MAAKRPKLAFVREVQGGIVFRRAYAASPDDGLTPMLTGMFPHAGDSPALTKAFEVVDSVDEQTIVVAGGEPAGGGWDERSLHVPLTIRVPGMKPPALTSDALISAVDVLPTVMSMAGLTIPEGIHGRVVALSAPPAAVFAEGSLRQPTEWRMVVRGFDKLVTTARLEPLSLFNLAEDPGEQNNLAREPGHRLRIDELRALLFDWRKRTSDGVDPSGLKRRRR